MVLQGFTGRMAITAEIGMQRMFAVDETFVQRLQQSLFDLSGHRPIDQRQFFKVLELRGQAGAVDGCTHRTLAQDGPRRCIQTVEKQAAGG
ncbi:hypothetical protein D3C73_875140 [compost metagenome]